MGADVPDARAEGDAEDVPDARAEGDSEETSSAPHPAFEPYAAEPVPQAAVGSPGKDGVLELTFARSDGETRLVHDYATVPFHISGTLGYDPHPDAETVFVQSPTGGVAQGDRHDVDIAVREGGLAHVSTQSSTKVQSMTCNYAGAETTLSVGIDAHLDYVPEPTILHENARFHQDLTLDLASGATAVVGDVVVPGRLARGERFDFERYLGRVRASGPDGDLLFEDATHLDPAASDPTAPGVLGEFAVYGTLFVVAPDTDTTGMSDELHSTVADCEARTGATRLPNDAGVVVRALGDRAETVQAALHDAWDHARTELIGAAAPSGRKH